MWLQRCELDRLFLAQNVLEAAAKSCITFGHMQAPSPSPHTPARVPSLFWDWEEMNQGLLVEESAPWQAFRLLLTPHSPAVVT